MFYLYKPEHRGGIAETASKRILENAPAGEYAFPPPLLYNTEDTTTGAEKDTLETTQATVVRRRAFCFRKSPAMLFNTCFVGEESVSEGGALSEYCGGDGMLRRNGPAVIRTRTRSSVFDVSALVTVPVRVTTVLLHCCALPHLVYLLR